MESIIERINHNKFWHFHGGIHPPEQKSLTSGKPIKQLPLPKQLILPLQQHIGRQGDLLVSVGDKVLKGQALTQSSNPMAVPVHAPTSGTVSAIKKSVIAHPSGLSELCLFIDVDGNDAWQAREICQDFTKLSHQQIIKKIADAGIAGMGGAGFPTHIKVNTKPDINFLIINAAECEPYITADDLLMCEQSAAIVDGIKILNQLLNPAFILIGIEDNKPQAIKALQHATKDIEKIKVCVLPTKYPTGGEKQLIKVLTGKEVKSGALPIHSGIVVQNVATCFAISDAVINDIPLIRRVVTLSGHALTKPQNVWALLGTPVNYLLEQAGFVTEADAKSTNPPVIMGGPLMGFSILNEQVPIVKTSNCILAPSKEEMPSAFDNYSNEVECIRCGQCAEVCPSQLLPQELQWSAKAKDHQQLMKLNLFDCIDCGACAYVCPSQIPLVQYYRVAKAEIRQQQQLDIKAEKAKARFEARKLRLEKEKLAREEKHKKAAAARKAAMGKKSTDGSTASSAVAAALARVKAKKLDKKKENEPDVSNEETHEAVSAPNTELQDDKSQVKAAIARAKAKKLAKNKKLESPESSNEAQEEHVTSNTPVKNTETESTETQKAKTIVVESSKVQDEKSQVKAAIVRTKTKKLAKNKKLESPENSDKAQEEQVTSPAPVESTETESTETESTETINDTIQDKGSQDENEQPATNTVVEPVTITSDKAQTIERTESEKPADDKKAKIAAAIAKAKAKAKTKKEHEQEGSLPVSNKEEIEVTIEPDNKKARIAAAVAKAKAKARAKAKKEREKQPTPTNEEST